MLPVCFEYTRWLSLSLISNLPLLRFVSVTVPHAGTASSGQDSLAERQSGERDDSSSTMASSAVHNVQRLPA
jgi:hypothetical protein